MNDKEIKEKIIENGIKNLKEFGFPGVTKDNILTDTMYADFFLSSLKENLGKGYDKIIKEIMGEIENNLKLRG